MPHHNDNVEFINKLKEISGHKNNADFAKACKKSAANMSAYLSGNKVPGKKVLLSCVQNLYQTPFLVSLKTISGHKKDADFAKACKKTHANISAYLKGKKSPGKKVLKSCLENIYGWEVKSLMELEPLPNKLSSLPEDPGIYIIYDSGGQALYLGKATNLRSELQQTLRRPIPVGLRFGSKLRKTRPKIKELTKYISLYAIPSKKIRHNFEVLLLRVFANQTHNSNIGNFL
jgi:hypothetical protein